MSVSLELDEFVKQLEDSGLVARGKLEGFLPPRGHPKDSDELARELVKQHHLTKFQAALILAGKSKALFMHNYTILDRIGAGGMGQVFKAEHRRMKRLVAIKLLPPSVSKDPAAIARFEREVEVAAQLTHPNIVEAHDADEANGAHFLVMEYVDGRDLSALVKKEGPLPPARAIDYIVQAARGLEFAHRKGVIHRDIKPSNLLLDRDGTVKVLDMGLARIDAGHDAATQAELTGTGTVMGTVDYMAPEQAMNARAADARADIYSLGCSLYYLLTGKPAFGGDSMTAKLLAHQSQPAPSLKSVAPEVPDRLEAVFRKMVAKIKEDRYQSMTEVIAELTRCQGGLPNPSTGGTSSGKAMAGDRPSDLSTAMGHSPLHRIDASDPFAPTLAIEAPAGEGGSGPKSPKVWIAAGAAGALLLVLGIWIIVRDRDGNEVGRVQVPDGGSVSVTEQPPRVPSRPPGATGGASRGPTGGGLAQPTSPAAGTSPQPAAPTAPAPGRKTAAFGDPAFQAWMKQVADLPAERQVEAVAKKLVELNPGFDGKVTDTWDETRAPRIENGVVTGLRVVTDHVTDISPVRALAGLTDLRCEGAKPCSGILADLSPLEGMRLTGLACAFGRVSDLSPLQGMEKLTVLNCAGTPVSDLAPLRGMNLNSLYCGTTKVVDLSPLRGVNLNTLSCGYTQVSDLSPLAACKGLTTLDCSSTPVSELSPLRGIRLTSLDCSSTQVSDLSPLQGMKLTELYFTPSRVTKGIDVVRQMESIKKIGTSGWGVSPSPQEFWKKYDAGEFGKPIAAFNDRDSSFNTTADLP